MPSKSEKQKHFMEAAAHNKEFADRAGIDQETAKHFVEEDQRLKHEQEEKAKETTKKKINE